MNKETIAYIRHIMGSDFVQLDIFNGMLSAAITVVCFIAFIGGNVSLFGVAFILGAVLAFFNAVKSIMKKTLLGTLTFCVMVIGLSLAAVFVYKFLLV